METQTEANKYANGKIYKITNLTGDIIYVGSTIRSIQRRFNDHRIDLKRRNTKFHKHLKDNGFDNFEIELIENHKCSSRTELLERETYYIKQLKPLCNVNLPKHSNTEYYIENKDKIDKYNKAYYYENHDKIRTSLGETIECSCGMFIQKGSIFRHSQRKYHLTHHKE